MGVANDGVDTLSDALPVSRGRLYTRTLNLLTATAFVLGAALVVTAEQPEPIGAVERPVAAGSPQALIEAHDCWTGMAPAGAKAGHVVASIGGRTVYGGQRLTDRALEQELFGVDHDLRVHGFCR